MATWFDPTPAFRRLRQQADRSGEGLNDTGRRLGLHREAVFRLLAGRRLRWDAADRIAVALGHHPAELWPEWFPAGAVRRGDRS